jgi:hypothetical protein
MRPIDVMLLILCALSVTLELEELAARTRTNRTNCRPPIVRSAASTNGRLIF